MSYIWVNLKLAPTLSPTVSLSQTNLTAPRHDRGSIGLSSGKVLHYITVGGNTAAFRVDFPRVPWVWDPSPWKRWVIASVMSPGLHVEKRAKIWGACVCYAASRGLDAWTRSRGTVRGVTKKSNWTVGERVGPIMKTPWEPARIHSCGFKITHFMPTLFKVRSLTWPPWQFGLILNTCVK